jgi:hypothetical protein
MRVVVNLGSRLGYLPIVRLLPDANTGLAFQMQG